MVCREERLVKLKHRKLNGAPAAAYRRGATAGELQILASHSRRRTLSAGLIYARQLKRILTRVETTTYP